MTELEIVTRAKMYVDKLARGIDPLSGKPVKEDDVVNNINISRCLFYVSEILQKVIDNGGMVQRPAETRQRSKRSDKLSFDLTDRQKMSLAPSGGKLSSSKITSMINELIDESVMKKLKTTTLNNWLVSIGVLREVETSNGKKRKTPTQDGELLGLSESEFINPVGVSAKYVSYDPQAQQFIFDNIDSVIEFARLEEAGELPYEPPKTE